MISTIITFIIGFWVGYTICKVRINSKLKEKFNYCYMDLTANKPLDRGTLNRVEEYLGGGR